MDDLRQTRTHCIAIHGRGANDIALVEENDGGEVAHPVEANAALISSAPDLYEALQYIFEHITDPHRGPRELYSAFGLNATEAITKAQAALSKARGETSPS